MNGVFILLGLFWVGLCLESGLFKIAESLRNQR